MKTSYTIAKLILSASMVSSTAGAAAPNCARDLRITKMQADDAQMLEKTYEEIYQDARKNNILSTSIFIPSALMFTMIGSSALMSVQAGGMSTFALAAGAPGIALMDAIASSLNLSNVVLPMILGWGSQAAPAVYALGHGAYRLTHEDKAIDLSAIEIAKSIQDLELVQKELDKNRAAIYEKGNYSQFMDGIMLGSLDRKWTFSLYNNAKASTAVAMTKHKLTKLQCEAN